MSSLWVVIPVKDFVNAKQRLSGVLSPSERRALSQAMVEDMLQCLRTVEGIEGVLLVSDDPAAELLAYRYGARVLVEKGHSRGLNAAVQQAADYLADRGASYMLVLHGDLPAIAARDISALIADLPDNNGPVVRLVPDGRNQGSNGLLCSLPASVVFQYGGDSFVRHQRACEAGGLRCKVMPLASLQLDIDTPRDLLGLLELCRSGALAGSKTSAVLKEYRLAARLKQMQLQDENGASACGNTAAKQAAQPDNAGVDHGN